MLHFLGFIFFIIIAILIIGLGIIGTLIRSIFGLGKRRAPSDPYQNAKGYSYQNPNSSSAREEASPLEDRDNYVKIKKIFSKEEGEYIDFEEIKEGED